jgi:hypothetical protein
MALIGPMRERRQYSTQQSAFWMPKKTSPKLAVSHLIEVSDQRYSGPFMSSWSCAVSFEVLFHPSNPEHDLCSMIGKCPV